MFFLVTGQTKAKQKKLSKVVISWWNWWVFFIKIENRKQAFTFVPPHTIKKKFVIDFEIDFDHSYTKVGIIYKRTC